MQHWNQSGGLDETTAYLPVDPEETRAVVLENTDQLEERFVPDGERAAFWYYMGVPSEDIRTPVLPVDPYEAMQQAIRADPYTNRHSFFGVSPYLARSFHMRRLLDSIVRDPVDPGPDHPSRFMETSGGETIRGLHKNARRWHGGPDASRAVEF